VFVVDSEADPAVPVVRELLEARRHEQHGGAAQEQRQGPDGAASDAAGAPATPGRYALRPRRAQGAATPGGAANRRRQQLQGQGEEDALIVSGPATECSQKIHK
jgi:hypothetical protein